MIVKEGLDSLDISELQQASRDRGMRAMGLSEKRLRTQLAQWLDLHLNQKIPISLLILSRALYLPEHLPASDIIKTTISALPLSIETAAKAKIAEASGEMVDNKTKLELLKLEDQEIKLEKVETAPPKPAPAATPVPSAKPAKEPVATIEKDFAAAQIAKEMLVDKAPIMHADASNHTDELTPVEIKEINQIIENLPLNEKKNVKSEIEELKKDVSEYKEDVKEVAELTLAEKVNQLTETKSAKALSSRVSRLIADMDKILDKLEKEAAPGEKHEPQYVNRI